MARGIANEGIGQDLAAKLLSKSLLAAEAKRGRKRRDPEEAIEAHNGRRFLTAAQLGERQGLVVERVGRSRIVAEHILAQSKKRLRVVAAAPGPGLEQIRIRGRYGFDGRLKGFGLG